MFSRRFAPASPRSYPTIACIRSDDSVNSNNARLPLVGGRIFRSYPRETRWAARSRDSVANNRVLGMAHPLPDGEGFLPRLLPGAGTATSLWAGCCRESNHAISSENLQPTAFSPIWIRCGVRPVFSSLHQEVALRPVISFRSFSRTILSVYSCSCGAI